MNEVNEGQKSAKDGIPDLFVVSPAFAERQWLRWLADREPFEGELATLAENVTLSIRELGLNLIGNGPEAVALSATNLEQRLAAFKAALTAGGG